MKDQRRHLIFISYRGSDQNWASELVYARMTEAFGADAVFKAGNALRAGEDFPQILRREAASCPVMLACIGPGWLTAAAPDGRRRLDAPLDWVREEIAISLQAGNHVVPLLIGNHDEVTVPRPDQVPESIRAMVHRQAVWLAPGRGLGATIAMLVDRLAELVPELAEHRGELASAQRGAAQAPRDEDRTPDATGTPMATRREYRRSAMASGEVAKIVDEAWPYVSAAVVGYGAAVLKTSEDAAASATVSLGRRILQRVFGPGQPPEALADLASDPRDVDLQAALRVALRKLLAEDDGLLAQVRGMLPESAADRPGISNIVKDSTVHGRVTQVGTINGNFEQR